MHNPEPRHVIEGRTFLYNAGDNSSHGDASCGSCHVFGDVDALAWDLGNPDETVRENPNRFVNLLLTPDDAAVFHPMKGPMTNVFVGLRIADRCTGAVTGPEKAL